MEAAAGGPVRVIVPGKCYRYEATDPTHESQFYQVEGLAVDEGISFANLKHTLYEFARRMFGAQRQVRFRCDYFPFVEPGVDMSIDCFACDGRGDADCRICRGSGWIEIMGAGMGAPQRAARRRLRPRRLHRLRLWHGTGAHRHAQVRHRRCPPLLRQRHPLPPPVRVEAFTRPPLTARPVRGY